MKDFQIVRYVSSWKYLIALCTVIGGVVFYSYFSRQQVYTAYAIISYTNLDAKSGKTQAAAAARASIRCNAGLFMLSGVCVLSLIHI